MSNWEGQEKCKLPKEWGSWRRVNETAYQIESLAITSNLWPYTFKVANKVRNHSPSNRTSLILMAAFAWTNNIARETHLHAFGRLIYVLAAELQVKKKIDKWRQWCKLGIYLGPSPAQTSTASTSSYHYSPDLYTLENKANNYSTKRSTDIGLHMGYET